MRNEVEDFLKIVPMLRKYNMRIIKANPIYGKPRMVPGRDSELQIYLHKGSGEKTPVLFEMHGGGFVLGDAAKNDNLREQIKNTTGITVIGINYRKAPEHPYPCAWQDVYDVIKYVHDHPSEFGIDPERIAVMGQSSGGNLAAVVSMKAAASKEFQIKCQILHYPYLDAVTPPENKPRHPADIPLPVMEGFNLAYNNGADPKRSDISPLYASEEELFDIAPAAIFTAAEDALSPEGHAFADRLRQAGAEVIAEEAVPEMHHGYIEDFYNQPLYEFTDEATRALHSPKMGEMAKETMKKTEAILKERLFG